MRTLVLRAAIASLVTVTVAWSAESFFYPSEEDYWASEARATCHMWAPIAPQLAVERFPMAPDAEADAWSVSCHDSLRVRNGWDYIEVLATDSDGVERVLSAATSDYSDDESLFWWFTLGISALVTAAVVWPVLRASHALVRIAERLSAGDLDARVVPTGPAELRSIGIALNTMADRLTSQLRMRQVLLRSVAHELGQPLTRARFSLELLDSVNDDDARQVQRARLERCLDRLEALSDGVARQLAGAHVDAERPARTALAPLIADVLDVYPQVERQLAPVDAAFDPELFRIALRNLVENAVRHAAQTVAVRLDDRGVVVEDDGGGLPDDIDALVRPFTQGNTGGRLGLGLSIVSDIARIHGWTLELDRSPLGGARFALLNPHRSLE